MKQVMGYPFPDDSSERVHLNTVLKSGNSTEIPQSIANSARWVRTVSRCTPSEPKSAYEIDTIKSIWQDSVFPCGSRRAICIQCKGGRRRLYKGSPGD